MSGRFFTHPVARGIDIDDPGLITIRRRLLRQKIFLHKLYEEWYSLIKQNLASNSSRVIELGSGAGFLERLIPKVIKTDLFHLPFLHLVMDGLKTPIKDKSIDAYTLLDVFHHLPDVNEFLREASRTLRIGGRIIMIEPWLSSWSRFVYSTLNYEPIHPEMKDWKFESSGPLSGSNLALPWIVFFRDKEIFQNKYPQFRIIRIQPMMPFRFLLSGGLSTWINPPAFLYPMVKRFEAIFGKALDKWGMFALIVLEKVK